MEEQQRLDPPEVVDEPENSLYCFMNPTRPCSGECIAYKYNPDDNKHLDTAQRHCVILQGIERGSRSLNILGGLVNELLNRQKRGEADAKRRGAFEPEPPGRKSP